MTSDVPVTQADRDAAAPFLAHGYRNSVELGVFDYNDLVQAFARHRHEATRDLQAEVARLREALEPFADAFQAARDKYIRRYGPNPMIGATNFYAMPDDWKMDTVMFTMGDFRRARTALTETDHFTGGRGGE